MCPRAGVPYPERVLCSLKNTIAMIEQKLGLKIEKVNGVGPDPQGNVTLVSGDSALTIEEDATQHQITVGLDRTELPSAAVTSVNGETGAVSLDASEIPYNDPDGYTDDVDEKLNALTGVQNALQLSINQERTRAQNAESGLQTNINTVTASLPTAAAAAVAADPTIASLVTADSQNVKLSGNQSISGVKTVTTQATGQYSTQIANSQKVINEINTYAVTTTRNQNVSGIKKAVNPYSYIDMQSTSYDLSYQATETNTFGLLTHRDANNEYINSILYGRRANGSKLLSISLNNWIGGENKQCTLQLNIYADGHANLTLSDANGVTKVVSDTSA